MYRIALLVIGVGLAGCGVRYHQPPADDSVAFHNALGERRYCPSPAPLSDGMTAMNVLAGGIGGAIGSSPAVRRAHYNACADSLRADGYVLATEAPIVTADELLARREQEAAAAAAETDRRNAER